MTVGSIEAGGTKFIVSIATNGVEAAKVARIPTTEPETTLSKVLDFFKENPVESLSIGTFGPVCLDLKDIHYGAIENTPKPNWSGTNMLTYFREKLGIPVTITTDVNASAYGEYKLVNQLKQDRIESLAYLTIGTGIGGGIVQNGELLGGSSHPEIGHLRTTPREDDQYRGNCPYHANRCFEGLASGPTIERRTGHRGENLPRTDPVFDLIRYYVGELAWDVYCSARPDRIVIGGSVLNELDLTAVRKYFDDFNHGYLTVPDVTSLIQRPVAKNNGSATIGNFWLAKENANA